MYHLATKLFTENNEYSYVNNPKHKENKGSAGWGSNPHLLQSGQAP